MVENFANRPNPLLYLVFVFPLTLLVLYLGYRYAARHGTEGDAGWAFGLGLGAIFGLIALILGFSFSFAAGRWEARRALVVDEADAIRAAFLRGDFLPPRTEAQFRSLLIDYTRLRLRTYAEVGDMHAERRSLLQGDGLQGRLWTVAATAAHGDPRNTLYADLSRSVIDVIAVSEEQEAALNNHVPRAVIGLILLATLAGALLFGLTFGRAKSPHTILAVTFCLLFAVTVFTIIDLDHPQGGFIGVDIEPLQATLYDMTASPSVKLIRAPVSSLTKSATVPLPRPK
jgi:hypothetical protein